MQSYGQRISPGKKRPSLSKRRTTTNRKPQKLAKVSRLLHVKKLESSSLALLKTEQVRVTQLTATERNNAESQRRVKVGRRSLPAARIFSQVKVKIGVLMAKRRIGKAKKMIWTKDLNLVAITVLVRLISAISSQTCIRWITTPIWCSMQVASLQLLQHCLE